jgi:hypothetical protein
MFIRDQFSDECTYAFILAQMGELQEVGLWMIGDTAQDRWINSLDTNAMYRNL